MTLSEFYREKMRMVERWQELRVGKTPLVCMDFDQRGCACELDADSLAHCVMMLGDLDLAQLDLASLHQHAERLPKQVHQPWRRGISLLEERLRA